MRFALHPRMLLVENHGLAADPTGLDTTTPPQAYVWDCFNTAQAYAAAFEVHEVALTAGFLPEEATTLSLTLAELAGYAVQHARGGVASVFFNPGGWRLEVCDSGPGMAAPPQLKSSGLLASVRLLARPQGGSLVVAQYQRAEA